MTDKQVKLKAALHKRLKVEAAAKGTTLQALLEAIVKQATDKGRGK